MKTAWVERFVVVLTICALPGATLAVGEGTDLPAPSLGWGQGTISLQRLGDADAPAEEMACGESAQNALRRADLALADEDIPRWAAHMAEGIRGGCTGADVERRLDAARDLKQDETAQRDALLAAAVRRDRPELFTGAVRRSAGRSLDGGSNRNGWADAVVGLAGLLAQVKNRDTTRVPAMPANRASPPSNNNSASTMTDRVYADIFADTKGTVEVTDDRWRDVHDKVMAATGETFRQTKRVTGVEGIDDEFESLPDDQSTSPGNAAPSAPGVFTGLTNATPPTTSGQCPGLYQAREDVCKDMLGKRPGSVCQCCPGIYGLDNCFWSEGTAPTAATHQVCEIEGRINFLCSQGDEAWITKSTKETNNIDNNWGFYSNDAVRAQRRDVRDVRITHSFDFTCRGRPANAVAGPIRLGAPSAYDNERTVKDARHKALNACCASIGAAPAGRYDIRCTKSGF